MMNGIYNKVAVGNELTNEEKNCLSRLDINQDATIDATDASEVMAISTKLAFSKELDSNEGSYLLRLVNDTIDTKLSKLDVNEDGTIDVRDVSEFFVYRKFITKCTANGISEEIAKQVVLSDFDNNNIIDSNDGQILLEILVHLKEPSEGIKYDINGDGNIDILDVSKFNINLNEISSKFNNN